MKPRTRPRAPGSRDRRYGSRKWRRTADRVLNRPGGPAPLCQLDPAAPPHPATVADHVVAVYPGMPDSEFYDPRNLQPACQGHNKAKGFIEAELRRSAGVPAPRPGRSIFARRPTRGGGW